MTEKQYREGMPAIPERMKHLPVMRGYPVPWFVAKINGEFDFRVVSQDKMADAITKRLCWVCGEKLGTALAFSIGPMCALNRTIGEPPSHRECAEFAVRACPFLNQSQTKRNEAGLGKLAEKLPTDEGLQISEYGLKRQPGAICLWITRRYRPFYTGPNRTGELLFELGKAEEVHWFCEGRPATREEVRQSIDSGLPVLRELADKESWAAVKDLERKYEIVMKLLPAEKPTREKFLFGSAARR